MTRLSFIIPTFNSEKTIGRALDSIICLGLPGNEYEVIVADDCSTDKTVEIVESYTAKIAGLSVIRLAQHGFQGTARNSGIDIAKGAFITFVDSDDCVLPDMVKALEMAEEHTADLCFCSMIKESTAKEQTLVSIPWNDDFCVDGKSVCEEMFDPSCILFLAACGYLVRTQFLAPSGVRFVQGHQAEDNDFTLSLMYKADTVCGCKAPSYKYIDNPESTIHKRNIEYAMDCLLAAERLMDMSTQMEDRPIFAQKTGKETAIGGLDRLALWSIGKIRPTSTARLYREFSLERRLKLAELKPGSFQAFVLKHKHAALAFLTVWYPIAKAAHAVRRRLQ